jgi:hypothetical protein
MTAVTPAAGDSWKAPCRIAGLRSGWARRPTSLQQLPAAIPGEVVSDVVLPVSEAVTNASCVGSCNIQLVKVAVGVQGGWIEATICDQAPLPAALPWRALAGVGGG